MFVIVDNETNCFQKTAYHGGPKGCTLESEYDNLADCDRFKTRNDAVNVLTYWIYNNKFEGRVIDYCEAVEIASRAA